MSRLPGCLLTTALATIPTSAARRPPVALRWNWVSEPVALNCSVRRNMPEVARSDIPGIPELGVPDGDESSDEVDVVAIQTTGFRDPHRGDGKQAQQTSVGRAAQRRHQPARSEAWISWGEDRHGVIRQ